MKRVWVTGHRGYIGPHLVSLLLDSGYFVKGVDINLYPEAVWGPLPLPQEEFLEDYRKMPVSLLNGVDSVFHLAALSNDALGALDPALTHVVNGSGVVEWARRAKAAGVRQFLFASSCSMYGKGGNSWVDESAALHPLTAYAEAKIIAEQGLATLADSNFQVICLRNATAYGYSPVLRLDLVVNNLLASGFLEGAIQIHSDGKPWRPLIHCFDIARAFYFLSENGHHLPEFLALNIGSETENYQVRELAEIVSSALGDIPLQYTGLTGDDPRSYKVRFRKLAEVLPHFRLAYDVRQGVQELLVHFKRKGLRAQDWQGDRFFRLRSLQKSGRINRLH